MESIEVGLWSRVNALTNTALHGIVWLSLIAALLHNLFSYELFMYFCYFVCLILRSLLTSSQNMPGL